MRLSRGVGQRLFSSQVRGASAITPRSMTQPAHHLRDILLLFLGVFACSTSVIFLKQSTVHAALVPGYRLGLAALVMLPFFLRESRANPGWLTVRRLRSMAIAGVLLSIHFSTWTQGARMTPAANGTLLVNLAPLVMPFVMFFQIGERINRREVFGTLLSFAGILWIGVADYRFDREHFVGDIVCFGSMIAYTLYLAFARANRDIPGLWLYVVPLYAIAAAFSFLVAPPFTPVAEIYSAKEYLLLVALALIPTVTGHTLMNRSMRHLRGQTVSLGTSTQFMFSALLAWLLLGDVPRASLYPAAALILSGVILVITGTPARPLPKGEPAAESEPG